MIDDWMLNSWKSGGRVEHGSEIRWVDDRNDLSDEGLLCRMTNLKGGN